MVSSSSRGGRQAVDRELKDFFQDQQSFIKVAIGSLEKQLTTRFDLLGSNVKAGFQVMDGRIGSVEARLDRVEARLGRVEGRLARMDRDLAQIKRDLKTLLRSRRRSTKS